MAWIKTVSLEEATGTLARLYREALGRAGKIWNVVSLQSLRPETLDASMALYVEVMHSPRSPLTRVQREMIATAVSRANSCQY
jgi:alkylhydroperoxidase family enzyme